MERRSGRFRVYRVVEAVPHYNFQAVDEPRLYTVYQSGYDDDRQAVVDDLTTGSLVSATLVGDADDDTEPWRIDEIERAEGSVTVAVAADVDPPAVAVDAWEPGTSQPVCRTLVEDGEPVGACCVQPREPLPDGGFVPSALTGLLPLESEFASVPGVDEPAAEALFLDPDPVDAASAQSPYGVALFFTADADDLPARFRDRYDLPRGEDTRPNFDPYGV
jgi:hypothetical protein